MVWMKLREKDGWGGYGELGTEVSGGGVMAVSSGWLSRNTLGRFSLPSGLGENLRR